MHSITETKVKYDSEKKHDLPPLFSLFGLSIQSQVERKSHPLWILLTSLMTREFRYLRQLLGQ